MPQFIANTKSHVSYFFAYFTSRKVSTSRTCESKYHAVRVMKARSTDEDFTEFYGLITNEVRTLRNWITELKFLENSLRNFLENCELAI